jgi:tRNA threonylcarbamoyl adenosine modification protein (Sua5/YciO/YrdC/YwlC family)
VSTVVDVTEPGARAAGLAQAVAAVNRGDLVVLPTDTVYGLGADAFNALAVRDLLAAKGRGRSMPPPVLVPTRRTLDGIATELSEAARDLVDAFWPGALTLICWAQPSLAWDLGDTRGTVAVRMPDHDVALELLARTGPLAVSSANVHGHPPATTVEAARAQLGEAVAVYLDAGPTAGDTPSTIVDVTADPPRVIRLGALSVERLARLAPGIVAPGGEPEAIP